MSPSILDSFDPFATHPFTNGSGVIPEPPPPSEYPLLIPSPRNRSHFLPTFCSSPSTSASLPPQLFGSPQQTSHLKTPHPRHMLPPSQQPVIRPVYPPSPHDATACPMFCCVHFIPTHTPIPRRTTQAVRPELKLSTWRIDSIRLPCPKFKNKMPRQ
ncbi:hypothetical protein LshimejAT787_0209640 [Lyophyllum shimeji]|uniref:Uncharacterized protein n=1 Tax=Lyophyllum shimeji TaxID=47721 RepID=A0A9P3PH79_LYOSH|nr:hypothetical protein LshimejAT787_0209640 [Lyophyllum shimeji]